MTEMEIILREEGEEGREVIGGVEHFIKMIWTWSYIMSRVSSEIKITVYNEEERVIGEDLKGQFGEDSRLQQKRLDGDLSGSWTVIGNSGGAGFTMRALFMSAPL